MGQMQDVEQARGMRKLLLLLICRILPLVCAFYFSHYDLAGVFEAGASSSSAAAAAAAADL